MYRRDASEKLVDRFTAGRASSVQAVDAKPTAASVSIILGFPSLRQVLAIVQPATVYSSALRRFRNLGAGNPALAGQTNNRQVHLAATVLKDLRLIAGRHHNFRMRCEASDDAASISSPRKNASKY